MPVPAHKPILLDPDGDDITVDGTIKMCEDLAVDPEDVVLLAVAYELKSPRMGEWTRKGWTDGWKRIGYVAFITSVSHFPASLHTIHFRLRGIAAHRHLVVWLGQYTTLCHFNFLSNADTAIYRCDTIATMKASLIRLRDKLGSDAHYFQQVYNYAFEFSRPAGQRSLGTRT